MVPPGNPQLAPTVRRFAVPITLRRYAVTTTLETAGSEGLKALGLSTETTVRAAWWDAPADVMQRFAEGGKSERVIQGALVPDAAGALPDLRTVDEDNDLPADVLVIDGLPFEVEQVTRWPSGPAGTVTWVEFLARQTDGRPANPGP